MTYAHKHRIIFSLKTSYGYLNERLFLGENNVAFKLDCNVPIYIYIALYTDGIQKGHLFGRKQVD